MTGRWQIIGYFGESPPDGVPVVLPAAVLDTTGDRIAVLDVAESELDLQRVEHISLATFRGCIADGSAAELPASPWHPGVLVLVTAGVAELLDVEASEVRLLAFVRAEREAASTALERGDDDAALEHFDRARRVSNEREDIEWVAMLAPDPGPWLQTN